MSNEAVIQGLFGVGILGVCFSFVRMMNGRLKNKVTRQECHGAQNAIKDKIDSLEKHLDTRFDDLKDTIDRNGKG